MGTNGGQTGRNPFLALLFPSISLTHAPCPHHYSSQDPIDSRLVARSVRLEPALPSTSSVTRSCVCMDGSSATPHASPAPPATKGRLSPKHAASQCSPAAPFCPFVFLLLSVMTISCTLYRHDDVFLQEHFARFYPAGWQELIRKRSDKDKQRSDRLRTTGPALS